MRTLPWLLGVALLTSCAVDKKGILVDVEPGTPMDQADLHPHCDLGDRAACVLSDASSNPPPDPSLPLLQGVAPPDRAVFAVLEPKGQALAWFIYDSELSQLTKLFTVKPISRGTSAWALQRLDARGLNPKHHYAILGGDNEGRLVEFRRFRTLQTEEKVLRADILTGWRFTRHEDRLRLLSEVRARNPQLLVLAGSTVNAALPAGTDEPKGRTARDFYFERYSNARAAMELALAPDLLPVTALWNDDELGRANANNDTLQRDEARELFELFFPHWADEVSIVNGPGITISMDFHSSELALLDDISYRRGPAYGPPVCHKPKGHKQEICKQGKATPPSPATRYGPLVLDWVSSRAEKAGRPLWLLSGGPTLTGFESEWYKKPDFDSETFSQPPSYASLWELEINREGEARITKLR